VCSAPPLDMLRLTQAERMKGAYWFQDGTSSDLPLTSFQLKLAGRSSGRLVGAGRWLKNISSRVTSAGRRRHAALAAGKAKATSSTTRGRGRLCLRVSIVWVSPR
jgi:hypothetical protein